MNIHETSALLAMVAANDRRTVGEIDVEVWHDALNDLEFDDCRDAVRQHIRSSRDWLTPFDVRQAVKRIRRDRLDRALEQPPDADPDDPAAYTRALRDGRARTAGDLKPRDMRAIDSVFPSPPAADTSGWVQRARRMLPARRPQPAEPTHSQAIADMDRMLAEQTARRQALDESEEASK